MRKRAKVGCLLPLFVGAWWLFGGGVGVLESKNQRFVVQKVDCDGVCIKVKVLRGFLKS